MHQKKYENFFSEIVLLDYSATGREIEVAVYKKVSELNSLCC